MPFWFGSMGSHDDSSHQGSAKRNAASGVTALDSSSRVLAPVGILSMSRDGSNDISIQERTSGETALLLRRTGANAFTLYNNTVAGGKIIQDSSMKDVASGIAGLGPNLGISGKIYAALNFLHFFDTNISTNTLAGSGAVTQDLVAGTITINAPAGNDIADRTQDAKTALGTKPRVMIFRVSAIAVTGNTQISIGLLDAAGTHYAKLDFDGTNWNLATKAGGAETRSANLTAPAAADIFILYATSAKVALYKNGVFQAANVATLPTSALGMGMFASAAAGANSGSFTLDMLGEQ